MLLIKEMIRAENNNREKSDKKPIKGGIARLLGGELGRILEFCHTKSRGFWPLSLQYETFTLDNSFCYSNVVSLLECVYFATQI